MHKHRCNAGHSLPLMCQENRHPMMGPTVTSNESTTGTRQGPVSRQDQRAEHQQIRRSNTHRVDMPTAWPWQVIIHVVISSIHVMHTKAHHPQHKRAVHRCMGLRLRVNIHAPTSQPHDARHQATADAVHQPTALSRFCTSTMTSRLCRLATPTLLVGFGVVHVSLGILRRRSHNVHHAPTGTKSCFPTCVSSVFGTLPH